MLPNIASPLASAAPGAALPLASGPAAAPPPPAAGRGRAETASPAQAADAFLPTGKIAAAPPRAKSARAPAAEAGYAAGSKPAMTSAAPKASAAKKATAAPATAASSTALAFLDDKNLSVEEKLMRLLSYLNAKWDKDLEKKLKEFETGQRAPTTQGTSKKKSGGLLGSIGSAVKAATSFFPAVGIAVEALKNPAVRAVVSKIGGPVLAAAASALGYPALSPLLLKYGSTIVDAAAGVATSLDGPSGSTAARGGSSSAQGSPPSETGMNDREMQLKLMEIQRIRDLQKEMFSMVSHILRSGHETRMNVIQNIR